MPVHWFVCGECRGVRVFLLPSLLGLAIFSIDIETPLGLASGFLYILPLLFLRNLGRATYFTTASAYSLLIGIGLIYGHSGPAVPEWIIYGNRTLSVLGIWICASLMAQKHRYKESARSLAARILAGQDAERRRIAMDVHDSLGQISAGLSLLLQDHRNQLSKEHLTSHLQPVDSAISLALRITSEIRDIANRLFPAILESRGLDSALRTHIQDVQRYHRISIDFYASTPRQMARASELCLFRVAQECLTNVIKHSGADQVRIRLTYSDEVTTLSVRDNGRGADREVVAAFNAGQGCSGLGLSGILERVHDLGGAGRMESNGEGTTVSVTVPSARFC